MGGRGAPRGNGFGGNRNPNEYGSWDRRQGGPMQDKIETTFTVPSSKCGIIIGKGIIHVTEKLCLYLNLLTLYYYSIKLFIKFQVVKLSNKSISRQEHIVN